MEKLDFDLLSVHKTPDQSPGFLLWRISTLWRNTLEATLKSFRLTHPQFVVLATLGWLTRKGISATQREIGSFAKLDPNTTSQILKGLKQKNLIQRVASSDKRVKSSILTEKGKTLLSQALPAIEKVDHAFFDPLPQKDLKHLVEAFHKLQLGF